MKVLIIEDEDDIRHIATLTLTRVGGMDVVGAASGKEGLEVAAKEKPDVILLDVMMPHEDGPTTLAKLKGNASTSSIPVIFLTAKAMDSELEKLRGLGVRGVLTKPFDPMKLPNQIRQILNGGG